MCNAYKLVTPAAMLFDEFSELGLPILKPDRSQLPNLEPRPFTRPTNELPILRPLDPSRPADGLELTSARWGLVPFFHKGPTLKDWKLMCTNARMETAATAASFREAFRRRRCLVPADGFFEWTGPKGGKLKHEFTPTDGRWFSFAGLWDRWTGPDGAVETFTILTTTPGPDAEPFHDRQPVILERGEFAKWLDLGSDPAPLLRSSAAGALLVEPPEPKAA